jgi:valyl-tRNA synthetase
MNLTESDEELLEAVKEENLAVEDKWILSKFNALAKTVNDNAANYELGVALAEIYSFTWDTFCDWYIEMAKSRIFEGGEPALTAKRVLVKVLDGILKLLHPYMPFITEEIYQAIPHSDESIMIAAYPAFNSALSYKSEEEDVERIIGAITAIRTRRAEMNVPPSKKAKLIVVTKYEDTFKRAEKILLKLASASEVVLAKEYTADDAVMIATDAGSLYIPLAEVIDFEKERARLTAEMKKNDGEIERIEKKLANEGFVAKAPAAVIEGERAKLAKYLEVRESLKVALAKLS